MKVAVVGCCHGELDKVYESIEYLEKREKINIELLLICGDFQAVRNPQDLACLACPSKYREMNTFYKYYSGEKKASVLTLYVGGNHEASNYQLELFHGGWVAPNIYFMGYANVLNFGGLRIAGLSGIFKQSHFRLGHFERPPFDSDSLRSIYHVREFEIFRLLQLSGGMDILISHDWPRGIDQKGNTQQLLRRKPFLEQDIREKRLGSPPSERLIQVLQPKFWFAAHLHVKFPAIFDHGHGKTTKFLALDKCLPRRDYMQILDFPDAKGARVLKYDEEWLAIVRSTHNLLVLDKINAVMPALNSRGIRFDYRPTEEEKDWLARRLAQISEGLVVPRNFVKTVPAYDPTRDLNFKNAAQPGYVPNLQTKQYLDMLHLPDSITAKFAPNFVYPDPLPALAPPPASAPAAAHPNPDLDGAAAPETASSGVPASGTDTGNLPEGEENPEEIALEDSD
eukprot:g40411.t1